MLRSPFASGRNWFRRLLVAIPLFVLIGCPGQPIPDSPTWSEPYAPYKVIDNIYYVGSRGLASYLITTSAGHILINSNLLASPALIRKSVELLGFRFSDIKILLISHAHWDHCAGSAEIK